MENEETNKLAEAREDYPIGTVFKSAYTGNIYTIKSLDKIKFYPNGDVTNNGVYLYDENTHKWAKILYSPNTKILNYKLH